ncbi:MAG TPA: GNAT family N-acetyltransferase [Actinomycetota bacterium]|nr:GNAT family N-acetyltransferase [Actinomycetota bacterium]
MAELEPLLRFWRALDSAFETVEPAWWGGVVADSRFPAIWDVNYARVETDDAALSLGEVESSLLPVMDRIGARHVHMVVFHPEELTALLSEASTRGDRLSWDTVMELRGEAPDAASEIDVEEVDPNDPSFWPAYRASLGEFHITEQDAIRQLLDIERDVLIPAGKRWFAVRDAGRLLALGSLIGVEGEGYVDHVVTIPEARRRGYAGAVVRRISEEARRSNLDRVYLLTEPEAQAASLYERLGFEAIGHIASTLRQR